MPKRFILVNFPLAHWYDLSITFGNVIDGDMHTGNTLALIDAAVKNNMPAVGLTDFGNLFGKQIK